MGKLPQGAVKNPGLQGETWKYDEHHGTSTRKMWICKKQGGLTNK